MRSAFLLLSCAAVLAAGCSKEPEPAPVAATPKPADFDRAAERSKTAYGFDLAWPVNLKVLDGLIACFGRSYNEAYGDCRPEASAP